MAALLYSCTRADSRGLYDKTGSAPGNNSSDNGNASVPPGAPGANCAGDTECNSGFCTDGVCCDQRCDGECVACTTDKTGVGTGTCSPVSRGTDPDGECSDEGAASCGQDGSGCNGDAMAPGCSLYPEGTSCAAATCEAGQLSGADKCDGLGTCVAAMPESCRPYVCNGDGTGCLASCRTNEDCSRGHVCAEDNTCRSTGELGSGCEQDGDCTSNACSDGVCCDAACDGDCDTCVAEQGASVDGACTIAEVGSAGVPACNNGFCGGSTNQCLSTCGSGTITRPKVDLIAVVDNTSSMNGRATVIEEQLGAVFTGVLDADMLDYRVILFSRYGYSFPSERYCIETPLGGFEEGECADLPPAPSETERFFHYSRTVDSTALCRVIQSWDQGDDDNRHTGGLESLLREDAFKAFLFITDDEVDSEGDFFCEQDNLDWDDNSSIFASNSIAAAFDQELRQLSSTQFGTQIDRNYRVYSMVGMDDQSGGNGSTAWSPDDPIETDTCDGGFLEDPAAAGTGYQALSILTEGLRFPMCNPAFYANVFNQIAADIAVRATVPCSFPLPSAGGTVDQSSVVVRFQSTANGAFKALESVNNVGACPAADSFYLDGSEVHLCPDTCAAVQDANGGSFDVKFACSN